MVGIGGIVARRVGTGGKLLGHIGCPVTDLVRRKSRLIVHGLAGGRCGVGDGVGAALQLVGRIHGTVLGLVGCIARGVVGLVSGRRRRILHTVSARLQLAGRVLGAVLRLVRRITSVVVECAARRRRAAAHGVGASLQLADRILGAVGGHIRRVLGMIVSRASRRPLAVACAAICAGAVWIIRIGVPRRRQGRVAGALVLVHQEPGKTDPGQRDRQRIFLDLPAEVGQQLLPLTARTGEGAGDRVDDLPGGQLGAKRVERLLDLVALRLHLAFDFSRGTARHRTCSFASSASRPI